MIPNFALIDAVKRDNEHDAEAAFNLGAEITARDIDGASLLEVAERYGAINVARILFRKGADANQLVGTQGQRILHRAVDKGNFGFTQLLIANHADVNAVDKGGKRPLHLAAAVGSQYICVTLIEAGATIDAQTRSGKTAIYFAASRGDTANIKKLLKCGARAEIAEHKGITPAMEAARRGHFGAAKLLIEASAQGEHSLAIEASKVLKAAEKAGKTDVALAIHETFGVPLIGKQQQFNWLE